MNRISIIPDIGRPMPTREQRLESTAKYETAMACMWGMGAVFSAIWSYALSNGEPSFYSLPLGIAALTLAVLAVGSIRNALHHRRLLGEHRAFLSNMKPTNRV